MVLTLLQKRKFQKNCTHDFIKLRNYSKYIYLCQHCLKKKKCEYSWQAEEFELKQFLLGHPVETYLNLEKRLEKRMEWETIMHGFHKSN
jgi:hypothetical protein